jgi:hypothetical protein
MSGKRGHQLSGRSGRKQNRPGTFRPGFDSRRNLKGPSPELHEIRDAIRRDGLLYVDQLFRLAKKGNATAVRVAIEQMLGRPPSSLVLTGPDGKPIQLQASKLSELSDEEFKVVAAAARIVRRVGGYEGGGSSGSGETPAT